MVQYSDEAPIDPLTLTVYPAPYSSSSYYEDDGLSFPYEKGVYVKRTCEQTRTSNELHLQLSKAEGTYIPPVRNLEVIFIGVEKEPSSIDISGVKIGKRAWRFDSVSRVLIVRTTDTTSAMTITAIF